MDRSNFQMLVEVDSQLFENELVAFAGSQSQDKLLGVVQSLHTQKK